MLRDGAERSRFDTKAGGWVQERFTTGAGWIAVKVTRSVQSHLPDDTQGVRGGVVDVRTPHLRGLPISESRPEVGSRVAITVRLGVAQSEAVEFVGTVTDRTTAGELFIDWDGNFMPEGSAIRVIGQKAKEGASA